MPYSKIEQSTVVTATSGRNHKYSSCCISQQTGVKWIAILSCICGSMILLISSVLLLLNTTTTVTATARVENTDGNIISVIDSNVGNREFQIGKDLDKKLKLKDTNFNNNNRAKFIYMQPQTIAIMQVFSSMCLLSSHKEFRKFSLTWIIFHIFGVIVNIVYLWNLPSWTNSLKSSLSEEDNEEQQWKEADNNNNPSNTIYYTRLTNFLLNFIGVNLCIEIFSILVLIEFLRRPEYGPAGV